MYSTAKLLNYITDFVNIEKDISTNEIQIIQNKFHFCDLEIDQYINSSVWVWFSYIDEKLKLRIVVLHHNSIMRWHEGGKITLQLKNDNIISLTYTKNIGFVLLDEDFYALCTSEICLIQIKFSTSGIIYVCDQPEKIASQEFLLSTNCFAHLLKANKIVLPSKSYSVLSAKDSEPCYVYLMLDLNTSYYKIGISKNPKHREGTLQSEKPTIYMLAKRCYPNRKIALAIEKALHETYKLYHVRGEWYNLEEKDVEDLKLTLT